MGELYVEDPLSFWCNNYGIGSADVVFLGAPFDGTSTGRVGSRQAPNRIREMSYMLETRSPLSGRDLSGLKMADYGNVIVSPGNTDESLRRIEETVKEISDSFPVVVGGEHVITLAVVKALLRKHPKLKVLQLDAHLDLKDEHAGNRLSHVTVMRRLTEVLGKGRVVQSGARSFDDEERDFSRKSNVFKPLENLASYGLKGPVYVTIDMDVFDPASAPGVSTPVPGGLSPGDFFALLGKLSKNDAMEVVGFDVVEACPPHDSSDMTSLLAARVIKETLLAFRK
jgi:agmatinase